MCIVEIANNTMNSAAMEFNVGKPQQQHKKITYTVKKLLRQLFKQKSHAQFNCDAQNLQNSKKAAAASSLESLESLENLRNADLESHVAECSSLESFENVANERLSCEMEDFDYADITAVPVHFVRTTNGTFFWTAISDIAADNDLIEPLYCNTANQIAVAQLHDRWAQA